MIPFAIQNASQYDYLSVDNIPAIIEDYETSLVKKDLPKDDPIDTLYQREELPENTSINKTEYTKEEEYSNNYKAYHLSILTSKLMNEVSLWEEAGNIDGIIYISNIKDLIDEYQNYYIDDSESRIFFSTISLIFESSMWEKLNASQIKQFKNELRRYSDGKADEKEVKKFLKQLHRENLFSLEKI